MDPTTATLVEHIALALVNAVVTLAVVHYYLAAGKTPPNPPVPPNAALK